MNKIERARQIDEALKWVVSFKGTTKEFKKKVLDNPFPFVSKDFLELVMENKIANSIVGKKSSFRKSFMIEDRIYHLDPQFWQEQLKNKKEFKRKYPYFYVGQ